MVIRLLLVFALSMQTVAVTAQKAEASSLVAEQEGSEETKASDIEKKRKKNLLLAASVLAGCVVAGFAAKKGYDYYTFEKKAATPSEKDGSAPVAEGGAQPAVDTQAAKAAREEAIFNEIFDTEKIAQKIKTELEAEHYSEVLKGAGLYAVARLRALAKENAHLFRGTPLEALFAQVTVPSVATRDTAPVPEEIHPRELRPLPERTYSPVVYYTGR